MNTSVRSLAGILRAAGCEDGGIAHATNVDNRVPDADVSGSRASDVPLHNLRPGQRLCDSEPHIHNMGDANIVGISDLYNGYWVVGVLELVTCTADDCPRFADNARSGWNKKSGFYNVDAIGEVAV